MTGLVPWTVALWALTGALAGAPTGAPTGAPILQLDDRFQQVVHSRCAISGAPRQLVMFGLTSDGLSLSLILLSPRQLTLLRVRELRKRAYHLSVSQTCGTGVVAHDGALTVFNPTDLTVRKFYDFPQQVGQVVATDQGFIFGLTAEPTDASYTRRSTCFNLATGAAKLCSDCSVMSASESHPVQIAIHPNEEFMYVSDVNTTFIILIRGGCVNQTVYTKTNVFGANEAYFLGEGDYIISTYGRLYDTTGFGVMNLLPRGDFYGAVDNDKPVYRSVTQSGDSVAAIRLDAPEIYVFSWPYLSSLGRLPLPVLSVDGVASTSSRPVHAVLDSASDAGVYSVYAVVEYVVGGDTYAAVCHVERGVETVDSGTDGDQPPEKFEPTDYDNISLCVGASDTTPIVAYRHDTVTLFDQSLTTTRRQKLPLPVQHLAYDPSCTSVAFQHNSFLSVMSLADGEFYTHVSSVQDSSALVYGPHDWLVTFRADDSAPDVIQCYNLDRNTTKPCHCGGSPNMRAARNQHGDAVYAVSQGAREQVLTRWTAGDSCLQVQLSNTADSAGYYGSRLWVSPDGAVVVTDNGLIVGTDHLTVVGHLGTSDSARFSGLAAAPSDDPDTEELLFALEDGKPYVTVYDMRTWSAESYIAVPSDSCVDIRPVAVYAVSGRLLVISELTDSTQTQGGTQGGTQDTGVVTTLSAVWVSVTDRTSIDEVQAQYKEHKASCQRGRFSSGIFVTPTPNPSNSSLSPSVTKRSSYFGAAVGGAIFVLCIVIAVGMVLGLVMCKRRRPQSVMVDPLLNAEVLPPETQPTEPPADGADGNPQTTRPKERVMYYQAEPGSVEVGAV